MQTFLSGAVVLVGSVLTLPEALSRKGISEGYWSAFCFEVSDLTDYCSLELATLS